MLAGLTPMISSCPLWPTWATARHLGSERPRRLEVHVLNADLPIIYGQSVRFYFHRQLRDEQKFTGPDALKAQILRDCRAAHDCLAGQSVPPRFGLDS